MNSAWTSLELKNVITTLDAVKGARLQEVLTTEADVCLGFYAGGDLAWWWIDLNATRPTLLPWTRMPLKLKWTKTPLNLFLRAHFVGRALGEVHLDEARGRVVDVRFGTPGDDTEPSLEIRLFPHLRNVTARANEKQISWQKPRDLAEVPAADHVAAREPRTLDQLREAWLAARGVGAALPKAVASADPLAKTRADLEKRLRAMGKVEEELQRKRETPWALVGTWLKTNQSLDVPRDFEPFVDRRRKLAWNIETCFTKARELDAKTAGTELRRDKLNDEIEALRARLAAPPGSRTPEPIKPMASPLSNGSAQGRTLRLGNDLVVVAGKSAADNLKLLRRARAWDFWIHLRDYPSSHAILFRNKNAKVDDETLRRVAGWFVKLHLGQKHARASGEKFELLIAECRHVHPIKGDKIGRVTFRDERTLIYRHP